jgi:signal transduction histidine kinase
MNVKELENFEIDFVLHQARSMFHDEALANGLDFRVVRTSHIANGSPFVIMRVLANLISNAIKNTDHGKILIGCRRQGDHIRIDVCDTGAGIAAANIDRMQEPYQRTGTYDGAGLGLSIVRQLCDEHGLTFNIRSEPGRGSVASLLIPKAR